MTKGDKMQQVAKTSERPQEAIAMAIKATGANYHRVMAMLDSVLDVYEGDVTFGQLANDLEGLSVAVALYAADEDENSLQ